ncbi:MAG TPA: hypothetical protein VN849_15440, partial [Stellaceae bacterium]|nr:hypothetical protein [Stellaceae bacterium]
KFAARLEAVANGKLPVHDLVMPNGKLVGECSREYIRELSRNAVCAKLTRLGLKRGHKPPTAKPRIRPVPKRMPASLAACARPAAKKVSGKTVGRQPKEFSKRQLYAMLTEAVRNTG